MPTAKVDIVNMALAKLGVERISTFGDNVKAARLATDLYDLKRDEVLSKHTWDFALKRATLAKLVAQAPFGDYLNQFQLPTDFLRPVYLEDRSSRFKIEGTLLLTDESSAKLLYVYRCEDTTIYTPTFTDALATKLAIEFCIPLIQSREARNDLVSLYDGILGAAKSYDSIQGTPDDIIMEGWTSARGGSGRPFGPGELV